MSPDPDDCPHEKELRRGDDFVCVVCGHVTGPPAISVGKGREAVANVRRILRGDADESHPNPKET